MPLVEYRTKLYWVFLRFCSIPLTDSRANKEAKNEEDKEEAKEAKHSKDLHEQVAKLIKSQEKTNEVLAKFAKTQVRKTNLSSSAKKEGVEADVERNLKRFE